MKELAHASDYSIPSSIQERGDELSPFCHLQRTADLQLWITCKKNEQMLIG